MLGCIRSILALSLSYSFLSTRLTPMDTSSLSIWFFMLSNSCRKFLRRLKAGLSSSKKDSEKTDSDTLADAIICMLYIQIRYSGYKL